MSTTRKTRAQRVQLQQAGVPPSPPQALTDEPRGRRRTRQRKARLQTATQPSTGAQDDATASTQLQSATNAFTLTVTPTNTKPLVATIDVFPTTQASAALQQAKPQGRRRPVRPTASKAGQRNQGQSAQAIEKQGEEGPSAPISEIPASFVAPSPTYVNACTQTSPQWAPMGGYLSHQHLYHPECSPFYMELPRSPTEHSESDSENELVIPSHKRFKTKAIAQADDYDPTKMFDARGNLRLGPTNPPNPYTYRPVSSAEKKRKRCEIEEHENEHNETKSPGRSSQLQTQPQAEHVPETPSARGWGLTSLIPSVKSVSKFFPFSSSRTPSADTVTNRRPAITPGRQSQAEILDFNRPNPHPVKFARQPHLRTRYGLQKDHNEQEAVMDIDADEFAQQQDFQSESGPQTEPRQQNGVVDRPFHDIYCEILRKRATEGPPKRHEPRLLNYARAKAKYDQAMAETQEQRTFREQQEDFKAQQEELAKERETISKERARLFSERKKIEAELEAAQVPGTKRKRLHTRLPSPDVIPNPVGVGFGMDLTYFGHSDTGSDSDEEGQDSPTKARAAKRIRQSLPDNEILGDPHAARPYTGTKFAAPESPKAPVDDVSKDNTFDNQSQTASNAMSTPPARTIQPNSFRVPSPSDSDSDEDEEHEDGQTPTKGASSTTAATQHTSPTTIPTSNESHIAPVAKLSSISEPEAMAPPPRPNPSHASLPPTSSTTGRSYVDAVEKARQKALMHQPRTGSRLRESSRLSTSTVGSEGGEDSSIVQPIDKNKVQDEFEYDPEIEGQHIPRYDPAYPGLRLPFTGTQHPSASLVGPRHTPAVMPSGHVSAYDDYVKTVNTRVRDFVEHNWDDIHDTQAAIEDEEAQFVEYIFEEQQADTSDHDSITATSATIATFPPKATFTNNFVTSDKVQQALNAGWTPADAEAEAKDLDRDYDAFTASRTGQCAALGAAA